MINIFMYTRLSYHKITNTILDQVIPSLSKLYIYKKKSHNNIPTLLHIINTGVTTLFRNTIFYHPKLLPRRLPLLVAL